MPLHPGRNPLADSNKNRFLYPSNFRKVLFAGGTKIDPAPK